MAAFRGVVPTGGDDRHQARYVANFATTLRRAQLAERKPTARRPPKQKATSTLTRATSASNQRNRSKHDRFQAQRLLDEYEDALHQGASDEALQAKRDEFRELTGCDLPHALRPKGEPVPAYGFAPPSWSRTTPAAESTPKAPPTKASSLSAPTKASQARREVCAPFEATLRSAHVRKRRVPSPQQEAVAPLREPDDGEAPKHVGKPCTVLMGKQVPRPRPDGPEPIWTSVSRWATRPGRARV